MRENIVYLSGDWYACGRKLLLTNAEMPKHQTSKLRQTNFNRGTIFKTQCAKIKAQFLLCCSNTFLTEVTGKSCGFIFKVDFLHLHVSVDYKQSLIFLPSLREHRTRENDVIVSRVSRPNRSQTARCAWHRLEGKVSLHNSGYFLAFLMLAQSGREARNTRSRLSVPRAPRPLRARLENAKEQLLFRKLRKSRRLFLV